jgi:hypothetical protein
MTQTSTLTQTVESIPQRLMTVEQQVRALQAQVARLSESRNGVPDTGLPLDDPAVKEALRIAVEMFGDSVEVVIERDPENPEHEFVAFDVECRGEPKELVRLRHEWHERVDQATNDRSREFRLSIYPI